MTAANKEMISAIFTRQNGKKEGRPMQGVDARDSGLGLALTPFWAMLAEDYLETQHPTVHLVQIGD